MNFREVNKKLNELKQNENKAKGEYLLARIGSEEELISNMWLDETRYQLDQFRNTKISNGGLMKKFKFTTLNADHSLHKSIIFAKDLNDAHQLWVD